MRDWSFYLVNFCLPPMVCAQYFFPAQWHLLQPAEVVLFFSLGFCSWEVSTGWLSDSEVDFGASEGSGAAQRGPSQLQQKLWRQQRGYGVLPKLPVLFDRAPLGRGAQGPLSQL